MFRSLVPLGVCLLLTACAAAPYEPGHDRPGRPDHDWDRSQEISCDSQSNAYRQCSIDIGRYDDVRLRRQESVSDCVEGRSWGWNRRGIWVDRGCRARFEVIRR